MTKRPRRFTALDGLLIALLLAVPAWAIVRSLKAAGLRPAACVYQDNRLLGVYELDRDQTITVEIPSPKSQAPNPKVRKMRIQIRGGAIRVGESDCPKGVCKHTGWVRTPGRSIVCVPNRVLIELKGSDRGHDAETY